MTTTTKTNEAADRQARADEKVVPETQCCSAAEQQSCCAAEDKAECCGATTGGSCGCR